MFRRMFDRRAKVAWLAALLVLVGTASFAIANPAGATHFRYGNSTWKSLSGNSVQFTVDDGFRRDGYTECYDPTTNSVSKPCTGADGFPAPGDIISEDIGETEFNFGDGSQATPGPDGSLLFLVDSVDPTNDVLQGRALDTTVLPSISTAIDHTYATAGTFTAFTDSCCRLDTLQGGNADGEYRVETIVDAGAGNDAPTSNLPDVVTCIQGQVCNFQIPASDPDSDAITYRFSNSTEDSNLIQPPGATVSSSGLYSWDNTALANPPGLWATQVAIEDHDKSGVVKSKISLDFIINLITSTAPGDHSPGFAQSNPSCSSTVPVNEGQAETFTITAQDADAGDAVTLNASGLPAGSSTSPALPTTGAPGAIVSAGFSWTPGPTDIGDHVINFIASDPEQQSTLCSVTLSVTMASAAQPVTVTTSLTGDSQTGATITVPAGTAVTDAASLAGTNVSTAGGTIAYNVYSDASCTTLVTAAGGGSVTAGVAASSSPETLPAGMYYWSAAYGGDANNASATSACGSEVLIVAKGNTPPVANNGSLSTPENTAAPATLTATDVDSDALTYSVVAGPSHGTLSGTAPNLTYTPTSGYTGPDSFTFKANDGQADSNVATVSITVTPTSATCPTSGPSLDTSVVVDQKSAASKITSPGLTTSTGAELLLAFIEADGPYAPTQSITGVTGGGLTWTLAVRSNATWGTTEVWQAYAAAVVSNVKVTATFAKPKFDGSMTVAAFSGAASHVGAVAKGAGLTGKASATLTPTGCGSLVWAAGHDWTYSATPVAGTGQSLVHKFIDKRVLDSFWTQSVNSTTAAATPVTVATTGFTHDRWTLAAVEIPPAS
jgi:Bacterial Ig domain